MKEKPWEAKIPDGKPKNNWWWCDVDDTKRYSTVYIEAIELNTKTIKMLLTDVDFETAKIWIKKNKLPLINWQKFDYRRNRKWEYVFRFRNEESAMAFKLMWI